MCPSTIASPSSLASPSTAQIYKDDKLKIPQDSIEAESIMSYPHALSKGYATVSEISLDGPNAPVVYRLYKRRFLGVIGIVLLNIVAGMNWPWFGPIAIASTFKCSTPASPKG